MPAAALGTAIGVDDPFSLSESGLFHSVVCKTSESGEAFVGYKLDEVGENNLVRGDALIEASECSPSNSTRTTSVTAGIEGNRTRGELLQKR